MKTKHAGPVEWRRYFSSLERTEGSPKEPEGYLTAPTTCEDWAHLTAIARDRKHCDCFNAVKFIAEMRCGKATAQVAFNFFKQPTFTVVREINGRRTTIEEELPFIEHEDEHVLPILLGNTPHSKWGNFAPIACAHQNHHNGDVAS